MISVEGVFRLLTYFPIGWYPTKGSLRSSPEGVVYELTTLRLDSVGGLFLSLLFHQLFLSLLLHYRSFENISYRFASDIDTVVFLQLP